jgi:hypothetical protein
MMLIIMSIFVLIGVGSLTNSMSASGMINLSTPPSAPAAQCNATDYLNCYYGLQYGIPTGCNQNSSNCKIGGPSGIASIINPQSPFTDLFEGNIGALTKSLSGQTAQHGPFDPLGGGPYVKVLIQLGPFSGDDLTTWQIASVTQVGNDNSVLPKNATVSWANWNTNLAGGTYYTNLYQLSGTCSGFCAPPLVCKWMGQQNFSSIISFLQGTSLGGFTYYGCQVQFQVNPPSSAVGWWSFMVSIPNSIGAQKPGNYVVAYAQTESWDTYHCDIVYYGEANFQEFFSNQCLNYANNIVNPPSQGFPFIGPILGMVMGAVLFIIGMGLNFRFGGSLFGSGTTVGAGVNTQGSRMAQALGLFLLVWSPLYSEFGAWLSSGLMGSTGMSVFLTFIILGLGFFGVFWQMLSYS